MGLGHIRPVLRQPLYKVLQWHSNRTETLLGAAEDRVEDRVCKHVDISIGSENRVVSVSPLIVYSAFPIKF